jgi:proton-coupled amino acid transporter
MSWIVKILIIIMLITSYPLQMFPVHNIIENILYVGWPKSKKRQWCKNFTRTLMVLATCLFTKMLGERVDKFMSILGALSCTPVAFSLPAIFHYKACAKTTKDKVIDLTIFGISMIILVFCTTTSLIDWFSSPPAS